MNDKKRHILDTAIKCFANKGYHATSIQEIADTAGIAKGSLYFYFKSKEHLLISILEHGFTMMLTKMQSIASDTTLEPRERLIRFIEVQFEQFVENHDFIMMLFKEHSLHINEDMKKFLFGLRAQTIETYRSHVLAIYGEQVRPYLLDAAALFSGLNHEYSQYVLFAPDSMDFRKLAVFLADRLDDLMMSLMTKRPEPILSEDKLEQLIETAKLFSIKKERTVFDEISRLRKLIEPLQLERHLREDMLSSLLVLEAEFEKPEPQKVIVKGMLAVLKGCKEKEIRQTLGLIEAYL
ncbi:TetR/AcrR family transcriptional regulator [Paenibacillus sp. MBLB4367]|uniref:TetR/AcrR family transcriptional regulator n=1 Tax=Paenibacillus sp. MBLB4367 TaxID=3384767 RepID=UPI003907F61B